MNARPDGTSPPANLRNLGPKSSAWLQSVGLDSIDQIRRIGPVAAYRLVKQRHPQVSLNLLWALAAGIEDRDWRELTPREKQSLLAQLEED
ncbi:MAG: TfoX/Sxy family protein [Planctomycetaceae bacterium]|nr:TfoX/Sxy family protein [Planctomycetaceae bacterium]